MEADLLLTIENKSFFLNLHFNQFCFEEAIRLFDGKKCSIGDKRCNFIPFEQNFPYEKISINNNELADEVRLGMKNAYHSCQVLPNGWKMESKENDVMTTEEACQYLRISRPTLIKYLHSGFIRGAKAGKGWKILKSELDRFLRGETSGSMQR